MHQRLKHQNPYLTLLLNLWIPVSSALLLWIWTSWLLVATQSFTHEQEPKQWKSVHKLTKISTILKSINLKGGQHNADWTFIELRRKIVIRFEKGTTLCISTFDTNDWDTFSKLSFNTSVMAEVIASACFEGIPCPSSLLTYTTT